MTDNKMTAEQALAPLSELFLERESVFAAMRNMNSDDSLDYGYIDRVADIEAEIVGIIKDLSAPRVPHGWRLVPYKFSEEMFEAAASFGGSGGYSWLRGRTCEDAWPHILSVFDDAMLTASPEPVAQRPIVWQYTDEHGEQAYTTIKAKALESDQHPMPLYGEPVAQTVERDSGTLTMDETGAVSKIEPKRYEDTQAARGIPAENILHDLGAALDRIMAGDDENGDVTFILSAFKAWAESAAAERDLRTKVEALRKDAERLDWLDQDKMAFVERSFHWNNDFNGVRDAIDAARLREGGE